MSNELEAFIEYISVTRALSPKTVSAYQSDLLRIEAQLRKPLVALDEPKVLSLLGKIENRRTLNRKLSSLNAFFDFCHRSRYAHEVTRFKLSKLPKSLPKFLEYNSVVRGLSTIDRGNWIGKRDYALILFLYATGLRVSECIDVQRDDIEGEWLRVRHGKGEKERLVPVAGEALDALHAYLEDAPFSSPFLWLNYRGKNLSRITAYKITQKYLAVSPHTLRHSYATALILGGADLRVVQELLGHVSLLTTQIYTHIQRHDLQRTVQACHPLA